MPEPRIDQCKCGFVQRVPAGEEYPYGWERMENGSLLCAACYEVNVFTSPGVVEAFNEAREAFERFQQEATGDGPKCQEGKEGA